MRSNWSQQKGDMIHDNAVVALWQWGCIVMHMCKVFINCDANNVCNWWLSLRQWIYSLQRRRKRNICIMYLCAFLPLIVFYKQSYYYSFLCGTLYDLIIQKMLNLFCTCMNKFSLWGDLASDSCSLTAQHCPILVFLEHLRGPAVKQALFQPRHQSKCFKAFPSSCLKSQSLKKHSRWKCFGNIQIREVSLTLEHCGVWSMSLKERKSLLELGHKWWSKKADTNWLINSVLMIPL